ncbi:MAG: hypothetical protein VB099_01150 [Candidatus Limiplasma sp.]|nr:hypothetical protein [Candidatus Limiplasma sp.]
MNKKEVALPNLIFEAQVAHEKASAAYSNLTNDLFVEGEPNRKEYEFRYGQHVAMNSIHGDYLYRLGKLLEEMREALDGKEGTV